MLSEGGPPSTCRANRELPLASEQTMSHSTEPIVYWHRDLPPLNAELSILTHH